MLLISQGMPVLELVQLLAEDEVTVCPTDPWDSIAETSRLTSSSSSFSHPVVSISLTFHFSSQTVKRISVGGSSKCPRH